MLWELGSKWRGRNVARLSSDRTKVFVYDFNGGSINDLQVFDGRDGKLIYNAIADDGLRCIIEAVSPDGDTAFVSRIYSVKRDKDSVKPEDVAVNVLINTATGRVQRELPFKDHVSGAWFSPDGRTIALIATPGVGKDFLGFRDKLVMLDREKLKIQKVDVGRAFGELVFSLDGTAFATISSDTAQLWRTAPWSGHDLSLMTSVNDVSGIPTAGKYRVMVVDVKNVLHFRIFGDGDVVVDIDETKLTTQAGPIADLKKQLKNLWPPHQLTEGEKDRVDTAVTSIVGYTPWKKVGEPLRHASTINHADFSPDGDLIITASSDNTTRIWNAHTAGPIGSPLVHTGAVWHASFSPDSTRVATAMRRWNRPDLGCPDRSDRRPTTRAQWLCSIRRILAQGWKARHRL